MKLKPDFGASYAIRPENEVVHSASPMNHERPKNTTERRKNQHWRHFRGYGDFLEWEVPYSHFLRPVTAVGVGRLGYYSASQISS